MIDGSLELSQANIYSPANHRAPFGLRPGSYSETVMPSGFSFSMELKGGGTVVPNGGGTSDTYLLSPGLSAVLNASGFKRVGGEGFGKYVPYGRTTSMDITNTTENFASMYTFKLWVSPNDDQPNSPGTVYLFAGCTCDVVFNFVAGETATVDVTVNAQSVGVNANAASPITLFPSVVDYGTQSTTPAPVLVSAEATRTPIDSAKPVVAGFTTATISHTIQQLEGVDSNSQNASNITGALRSDYTTGFRRYSGPNMETTMTAEWYDQNGDLVASRAAPDFNNAMRPQTQTAGKFLEVSFYLGSAATVEGEVANGLYFYFDHFAITSYQRGTSGTYATSTIDGYAATVPNSQGFYIQGI